jgi:pimeloyl-ACP methyl ester carboxylesterase
MIETNGATVRVTERGAEEPALVFLHYWGGSSRTWQAVIDGSQEERVAPPSTNAAGVNLSRRVQESSGAPRSLDRFARDDGEVAV